MKDFIAVVRHEDNKVTKYQDFDTQSEADAHVEEYGGFVAENPSDRMHYWIVDGDKETLTYDEASYNNDEAAIVATKYQRDRVLLYPDLVDQLDDIYHNGIDGWKSTIKAVKDQHPKPD